MKDIQIKVNILLNYLLSLAESKMFLNFAASLGFSLFMDLKPEKKTSIRQNFQNLCENNSCRSLNNVQQF